MSENFRFDKIKEIPDKIKLFLGLETKKEKEFKNKFPGTPYIFGEMVNNVLARMKEDEKITPKDAIADLGLKLRRVFIDFARKGDSHGSCWEFSVCLRDIYNYTFEKSSIPKEALLIYGQFGKEERGALAEHHWVSIVDKSGIGENEEEADKKDLNRISKDGLIVDGTVDQYENWYGLTDKERSELCGNKLLLVDPEKDAELINYYNPVAVSGVKRAYFKPKNE